MSYGPKKLHVAPADHLHNWPTCLDIDEIDRLRAHLVPLREFVKAGMTGMNYTGGEALGSWKMRRRMRRERQETT